MENQPTRTKKTGKTGKSQARPTAATSEAQTSTQAHSRHTKQAAAATIPKATGALLEHEVLYYAVEGFIRGNSNFESSGPVNDLVDEIGKCCRFEEVFAMPIQHKIFTMEVALRWALFLGTAPARAIEEGDSPFSPNKGFDANEAIYLIASVYDVGLQEAVWEHFEDEDDDDEDDDEEDFEEEESEYITGMESVAAAGR
jgi:hypothetical protein